MGVFLTGHDLSLPLWQKPLDCSRVACWKKQPVWSDNEVFQEARDPAATRLSDLSKLRNFWRELEQLTAHPVSAWSARHRFARRLREEVVDLDSTLRRPTVLSRLPLLSTRQSLRRLTGRCHSNRSSLSQGTITHEAVMSEGCMKTSRVNSDMPGVNTVILTFESMSSTAINSIWYNRRQAKIQCLEPSPFLLLRVLTNRIERHASHDSARCHKQMTFPFSYHSEKCQVLLSQSTNDSIPSKQWIHHLGLTILAYASAVSPFSCCPGSHTTGSSPAPLNGLTSCGDSAGSDRRCTVWREPLPRGVSPWNSKHTQRWGKKQRSSIQKQSWQRTVM